MENEIKYHARQDRLRVIVNDARSDKNTRDFFERQAAGILTHLGMEQGEAVKFAHDIVAVPIEDITAWEEELHRRLLKTPVYQNLPDRMIQRAEAWYCKIKDHVLFNTPIIDTKTLDLGGGSGEVANLIMNRHNTRIIIADPLDYRRYKDIPFRSITGSHINAGDAEFDQTFVFTVYHHADDVEELVDETFRVTKCSVVIIESVTNDLMMYRYGCLIDWFYNHILQFSADVTKKINVPCNLKSVIEWERLIWKVTGRRPAVSENLGIYQWLNPENHHLFVYNLD